MKLLPLALAALSAAAIASATPALAQSAGNGMNGMNNKTDYDTQQPQTTGQQSGEYNGDRDWRDHGQQWGGGQGWGPHHGWNPHAHWMMGGHPGRVGQARGMRPWSNAGGARFHFQHGDSRIDIRCPAQQDLGECVDAAEKLLDKLAAMKQDAGTPPAPPNHPALPAPPSQSPGGDNGSGGNAPSGVPDSQAQ